VVSVRVIDNAEEFLEACAVISAGSGPLAIDAERASGFTYSQRAYLIQVHRREAGTFLFDPPAIGDMSELFAQNADQELPHASLILNSLPGYLGWNESV
jgi:ribonuclease D